MAAMDVDAVAAPPVFYKDDVRFIGQAVQEAAMYMYTGANASRTDSKPLRLLVQVGTYAVYFRAIGAMTDDEAGKVLEAVEINLRKVETKHPSIEDQDALYDLAMTQYPLSPPRVRPRGASDVPSPPGKRVVATPVSIKASVATGVNGPGQRAAAALAAGGGARQPFAPLAEVRTIPGTAAIIDAELKKLFGDFVTDTTYEYGPGVLISIAHAAAICAGLEPTTVGVVAGALHTADWGLRQYFKRREDDLETMVRAELRNAPIAAGRRAGALYAADVAGRTWLAGARRAASTVTEWMGDVGYNLWINMPTSPVGTGGGRPLTWQEQVDIWAAAAENTPLTFIPEFLAEHPYISGMLGAGAGTLLIARNYSKREVVYEKQRLKAWFRANNLGDANFWEEQINASLAYVRHPGKREDKEEIKRDLNSAMVARRAATEPRQREDGTWATVREQIELFIETMHGIDATLKDLLNQILNPEYDRRLNLRPAAAAAAAGAAGGLGLGPLAPAPGGGEGTPVVDAVFAQLHRVRLE